MSRKHTRFPSKESHRDRRMVQAARQGKPGRGGQRCDLKQLLARTDLTSIYQCEICGEFFNPASGESKALCQECV